MGSIRSIDDDRIRVKRTSSFPSNESVLSRNAQKQRTWKIICTLLCRWGFDWSCVSHNHFCQPAQYLRSSLRDVVKSTVAFEQERETCWGRAMWSTYRASRFIGNDTYAFGWNSCIRKSIAEAKRTSGKSSPTRSIDQDLYWSRWSRAILHDKGHWRVLTIYRAIDMSWVYVATRWQINWPERLDSGEHQNWNSIGSHNELLAR